MHSLPHVSNKCHPPLTKDSFSVDNHNDFPDDLLCSEDSILHMLSSLDTSKSSGPDAISAIMLKNTAGGITQGIVLLFNQSLKQGVIPQCWKESRIVAIPKVSSPSSPNHLYIIRLYEILDLNLERTEICKTHTLTTRQLT